MNVWRRTLQIAVALLFIAVPFFNAYGVQWFYGNLLSFKVGGLPLADPLAVAQVGMAAMSFTGDMLLGAGLVVLLAMILGPVFCSWLCPFGLFSELLHTCAAHRKKNPGQTAASPRRPFRKAFYRRWGGFFVKLLLVFAGLALCLLPDPLLFLNQLSLPGWYSRVWQAVALGELTGVFLGLSLLAGVLFTEMIVKRRLWCRYVCPQSVLISLARLLNPRSLRVVFQAGKCTCKKDAPCSRACSLDLEPRSHRLGRQLACTNCGQCIETCAAYGSALSFGVKRSVHRNDEPPPGS